MAADTRNTLTGHPGVRGPYGPDADADTHAPRTAVPAPEPVPLPDAAGPRGVPDRLTAHGCWYPSADPGGDRAAFVCDRGGVPQLWTGPADALAGEGEARLLDSDPDPVKEVSWSPDGRWIAYTTAPGGGEHTRVLCVRPDGGGRRILAGAEPGSSAYLGRWRPDGTALAVTVAAPPDSPAAPPDGTGPAGASRPPGWTGRDGRAVLLGGPDGELAAYLVDPEGGSAPALLAVEYGAATLRVCDLDDDGRLALLRRGPRGRREALVVRQTDLRTTCVLPVADGDPWIGGFGPGGRTVWLRSDNGREYAALLAVALDADGAPVGTTVAAGRAECELEHLALGRDRRTAQLAWNVRGASELETVPLSGAVPAPGTAPAAVPAPAAGPSRPVPLPHEVVTRIAPAGPGGWLLALSGSRRRPGVWWLPRDGSPLRTAWSSRDEDAVPPPRPPVKPVPLRPVARDGLPLQGWYYRAPGRAPTEPAPCVIHLHGGPEEQERPVFNPLYHEILGRGLDVFAPDVRGSAGHGRTFTDADLGAGRFAAIDDVADCAAHAVAEGPADLSRLAVMGRSYGGYLTMAALVRHPDLFRTGVAVCGMSDFAAFFAGTEPWIAQSAVHKYGHPERDRELLRALSPMSRIDALRAPVLAVHGEHDTNVPPGESERFVRAARERGVPAELLTLRDEGHEFLRAENRRLFRRLTADWLERHLSPG
ncbi:S9 family peptidase [Streptomyces carminius]|uniref:S9 family peptidase n=1 Tax=Streptomyces carminius TaxID=2665496 RepID=A0A2M8LVL6_9ACTN|nr:alpha/beta fold hydrolase [Streptomyces carminius]PJE95986.1 S9 family peptidase [Streptomyces carminius]